MIIPEQELDNDSAYRLICEISNYFGFKKAIFCAEDITLELESRGLNADGYTIDAVMGCREWRDMGILMDSYGYESLLKAVDKATDTVSEEYEYFLKEESV